MKFSYYPGCSLEGTAKDYAESILAVCRSLEIDLEEIPDWNCCGATAAHSIDHQASIALAARTLNLASRMPHNQMLVPCPMCFNRLKTASHVLNSDQRDLYQVELEDSVPRIWDLANFFATGDMLKTVAKRITTPLKGLNVVCYYGCMSSRPPEVTGASDWEDPQALDRIVTNLGGTSIPWPFKTDCCGASQILSLEEIESRLVDKLFDMARRVGARGIVVSCQMCQANLDTHRLRKNRNSENAPPIPVYYFTELIGLALGVKGIEKCLSRHITDPLPLLREL
ncbi:CoB--CoM heterodisulfide reductase iron-sulfur subunit B family protein, partial [Thermodesulfobacteriota bacterium]